MNRFGSWPTIIACLALGVVLALLLGHERDPKPCKEELLSYLNGCKPGTRIETLHAGDKTVLICRCPIEAKATSESEDR